MDAVFEVNKNNKIDISAVFEQVKKIKFELVLSPHMSIRTSFLVSKINANKKIGFKTWWNFTFFDTRVARDLQLPDALRQLSLLSHLDSNIKNQIAKYKLSCQQNRAKKTLNSLKDRVEIPNCASMDISKELSKIEKTLIEIHPNTVFIAPGSVWPTKRWSQTGYFEVAKNLVQTGFDIIFVGSKEERALCEELQNKLPSSRNIAGQTSILDLALLFRKANFLITNDSGAMHIASSVGLPTVAIFGPTTLQQGYEPWQNRSLVIQKRLSCRPCGRHGHVKCPIGTHECMKSISSQDVLRVTTEFTSSL